MQLSSSQLALECSSLQLTPSKRLQSLSSAPTSILQLQQLQLQLSGRWGSPGKGTHWTARPGTPGVAQFAANELGLSCEIAAQGVHGSLAPKMAEWLAEWQLLFTEPPEEAPEPPEARASLGELLSKLRVQVCVHEASSSLFCDSLCCAGTRASLERLEGHCTAEWLKQRWVVKEATGELAELSAVILAAPPEDEDDESTPREESTQWCTVPTVSLTKLLHQKQSHVVVHGMRMVWTAQIRDTVMTLKTNFADKYRTLLILAEDLLSEGGRSQSQHSPSSSPRLAGTPRRASIAGTPRKHRRTGSGAPKGHRRAGSDVASLSLDMFGQGSPVLEPSKKGPETLYDVQFVAPQVSLREGDRNSMVAVLMVAASGLILGQRVSEVHQRVELGLEGFQLRVPEHTWDWIDPGPLAAEGHLEGTRVMGPSSATVVVHTHDMEAVGGSSVGLEQPVDATRISFDSVGLELLPWQYQLLKGLIGNVLLGYSRAGLAQHSKEQEARAAETLQEGSTSTEAMLAELSALRIAVNGLEDELADPECAAVQDKTAMLHKYEAAYSNGVERLNARLQLQQEGLEQGEAAQRSSQPEYKMEYHFEAAQVRMRAQDGSELCELSLHELEGTHTYTQDGSVFVSTECKQLEMYNHLPNCSPQFRIMVRAMQPKTLSELKQKGCTPLLQVCTQMCPPVSGISVFHTIHIGMQPIAVALSGELVGQVQDFFFAPAPEHAPQLLNPAPQEPSALSAVGSPVSPSSEQVRVMLERESKVKALGHVGFAKLSVQVSWQKHGADSPSKLDFTDVVVHIPAVTFKKQCWTWEDLYRAFSKHATWSTLSQAGSILKKMLSTSVALAEDAMQEFRKPQDPEHNLGHTLFGSRRRGHPSKNVLGQAVLQESDSDSEHEEAGADAEYGVGIEDHALCEFEELLRLSQTAPPEEQPRDSPASPLPKSDEDRLQQLLEERAELRTEMGRWLHEPGAGAGEVVLALQEQVLHKEHEIEALRPGWLQLQSEEQPESPAEPKSSVLSPSRWFGRQKG